VHVIFGSPSAREKIKKVRNYKSGQTRVEAL